MNKWNLVSEVTPPDDECVLVCWVESDGNATMNVAVCFHRPNPVKGKQDKPLLSWESTDGDFLYDPTYWMPLPPPPEAK